MFKRSALSCTFLLGLVAPAASPAGDHGISGPYTYDNLTIFLVHGAGRTGRNFLTLQQALEQKKVVVYETGQVNELSIENVSAEDVYIQSGDIVKGGRQDRVFPDDAILTPKSGKLPISSFCVEHGRWSQRRGEAADRFAVSNREVSGKALKMAMRDQRSQPQVWAEVASEQRALPAVATASPTSMQLAVENPKVMEASAGYVQKLSTIIDGHPDVVGFAFAISGKLNSAEVYSSNALFRTMWPKLLNAAAVEALSERRKSGGAAVTPGAAAVSAVLADGDRSGESSKQTVGRAVLVKKESAKVVLFETRDARAAGGWVHRSYVVR